MPRLLTLLMLFLPACVTADSAPSSQPTGEDDVPAEVRTVMEAQRTMTHERILAASTRSVAIDVPGASHDLQLDQPDAIVSAVQRLLVADGDATTPMHEDRYGREHAGDMAGSRT